MKLALTNFSIRYPWLIIALVVVMSVVLGIQFPKVQFDNDPENMLSADEPVRVFHHKIKQRYDLYDFVIVGIVNEEDPDGIFNQRTLGRIYDLTGQLLRLHQTADGKPAVVTPAHDGVPEKTIVVDLQPESAVMKLLNMAFHHDPNRLFEDNGQSALVTREIISPSVVDNIKQAEMGSLKLEYLMENPPSSREEALVIRDDAMGNPLYKGTLVSEDGKAICLYLPITQKHFSHNVAALVTRLTEDWDGGDQIFITGLPVAEDTFGVEMLIQMATSAPMAGVAIFLLLLLFFRRISLIIAPMIVAVISIVATMGLLIGMGFSVHIMSSMIAIFLMPIAVADAVHILSEFYDTWPRFQDKAKTIKQVVKHLFRPMLFTSLTTMVGFASLATTPIPPVRVFGLFVAFGVGMAWILTMTLVPAYIMLFVPVKAMDGMVTKSGEMKSGGALANALEKVGTFSFRNAKGIMVVTMVLLAFSGWGISKIQVNDNPVNWFTANHPIRIADEVLNRHFGGTYTAYLAMTSTATIDASKAPDLIKTRSAALAGSDDLVAFQQALEASRSLATSDSGSFFETMRAEAVRADETLAGPWNQLADEILYLEADTVGYGDLEKLVAKRKSDQGQQILEILAPQRDQSDLRDAALALCQTNAGRLTALVDTVQIELEAPPFKQPEMLRYLDQLQSFILEDPKVGKVTTAVDALKKAAYELQYQVVPESGPEMVSIQQANQHNYAVPDNAAAVGQVFTQLEGMKRKDSLFHLVTRDYSGANMWVQLSSGDNRDMERVVVRVDAYLKDHPAPITMETGWAGLTYINVEWQAKMVNGMLGALISSFFFVLIMMIVLFRSFIFGILAMIPLSTTIALIYGLIGFVGKDYDMPVAVLSSLTLGLSVDFAIHFLERSREMQKQFGSWKAAIVHMFKEPAMAISRNAITVAVGFTPLLLAPLVPYKTVGFFLATIMTVSWMATLFILAALITLMRKIIFKNDGKEV